MNVAEEIERLRRMTVDDLRTRYAELFNHQTHVANRQFLVKRVIWGMQAKEQGGLSEAAMRRAEEIYRDCGLDPTQHPTRTLGPTRPIPGMTVRCPVRNRERRDSRLPMPGTVLTREYQGKTLAVLVLDRGFEHAGKVYPSLTALAKEITGAHWNGYDFMRIRKNRRTS